jgi:hypothetical protein
MLRMRRHLDRDLAQAAVSYATERHWPVAPGACLASDAPAERGAQPPCSCGRPDCRAPGAHPANPWWQAQATTDEATVRWWWSCRPEAPIVLPTGHAFDVLDVAEPVGCAAVQRLDAMGVTLGPVLVTGDGRVQFFVVPGARPEVYRAMRTFGRPGARVDIEWRGEGDFVFAPPSVIGAGRQIRWLVHPSARNRCLPRARDLLTTIGYSCYRMAASA